MSGRGWHQSRRTLGHSDVGRRSAAIVWLKEAKMLDPDFGEPAFQMTGLHLSKLSIGVAPRISGLHGMFSSLQRRFCDSEFGDRLSIGYCYYISGVQSR